MIEDKETEREIERIHRLINDYRQIYNYYFKQIDKIIQDAIEDVDKIYELYTLEVIPYSEYKMLKDEIIKSNNNLIDELKYEFEKEIKKLNGNKNE